MPDTDKNDKADKDEDKANKANDNENETNVARLKMKKQASSLSKKIGAIIKYIAEGFHTNVY